MEKKYGLSDPIHEEVFILYGLVYLIAIGVAALLAFVH